MQLVFFLKPLADMLYQLQILDFILTIICIFYLFHHSSCRLVLLDIVVILLSLLFLFSFVRNIDGLPQFLKIESTILLYFIGRYYYNNLDKYISYLKIGFVVILVVGIIAYFTGKGFVYWGNYNTFRSFYYFKTDLATAMTQCMIIFGCYERRKWIRRFVIILCLFFILISNARIFYFISLLVIGYIYALRREERKGKKVLSINMKLIAIVSFFLILIVLLLNYLNTIYEGELLLLSFSDMDDIYSGANTQGRNVIWEEVYDKFNNNDFLTRFVGVDLCSDESMEHNSHNLYLKILFSIGYLGSFVFLLSMILQVYNVNLVKYRKLFYVTLSMLTIYYIAGFSATTIESTLSSWLPMFFVGSCVSYKNNKSGA